MQDITLDVEGIEKAETEPFLQAVKDAQKKKYENIVALCTAEIDKSGKIYISILQHTLDKMKTTKWRNGITSFNNEGMPS